MILDISRALQQSGEQFPFAIEQAEPPEAIEDADRFPVEVHVSNVRAEGYFVGAGTTVFVRGRVKAEAVAECARCLGDVTHHADAPLHEVFGVEPDPADPERRLLQGHTLDLTDAVYSALALHLPIRFLCRPDCKGLCPTCGADLNDGACERHKVPVEV